jgi:excisionase family DNA binding protein
MKSNTKEYPNDGRATLNLEEVAALLGVSRAYIYARAKCGDLPGAFRLGRRWLVSRRALDTLLTPKTDELADTQRLLKQTNTTQRPIVTC